MKVAGAIAQVSCLLLCGLLTPAAVWGNDQAERLSEQRAGLQAEREAIEQAYNQRVQACWQRFAVNDCLREARRARYAALDPVRARELELNAEERSLRTQQREERLFQKQPGQEQRP